MKALEPQDLIGVRPTQPHGLFVWPFLGDGFTKAGLYVQYNDKLYPMYARVLAVGPGVGEIVPGDVIMFERPMCYDWVHLEDGRTFAAMDARMACAILTDYDEIAQERARMLAEKGAA